MGTKFNRLFNYVRHKCRWIKWNHQLRFLSFEDYLVFPTENNFKIEGSILIVAPHADDELIGCHQIISDSNIEATIFYCGFLGGNNSKENRNVREREIRTYANSQHRNLVISTSDNIEKDIEEVIKDQQPALVFLPSFIDWHPEHRLINLLFANVIRKIGFQCKIGWYHVSLPIPAVAVNFMSPMSEEQFHYKWRMMVQCYPSQLHMDIKRFKFIERLVKNSSYAIETYYLQTVEKWYQSLDTLQPNENLMDEMKHTLGQIDIMYKQTKKFYKMIL